MKTKKNYIKDMNKITHIKIDNVAEEKKGVEEVKEVKGKEKKVSNQGNK